MGNVLQHPAAKNPVWPEPHKGTHAEMVKWILDQSYRKQPMLASLSALITLSSACGPRYLTDCGLAVNLYGLTLGPTGCGKDAPIAHSARALRENSGGAIYCIDQVASGEGMEDTLTVAPNLHLSADEAAHTFMRMSGSNPSPHMITLNQILLRVFTRAGDAYVPRIRAKTKQQAEAPNPILRPHLTINAATTEDSFVKSLRVSEFGTGLLPRFLLARLSDDYPPKNLFAKHQPFPESLVKVVKALTATKIGGAASNVRTITYGDDALSALAIVDAAADRQVELGSGFEKHVFIRTTEKVKKIAGILAAVENPDAPVMNRSQVEWAARLVAASDGQMIALAHNRMSSDDADSTAKDVLRHLHRLSTTAKARNEQERFILGKGWIPKSLLARTASIGIVSLNSAVSALVEQGLVEMRDAQSIPELADGIVPGKPPTVLRLLSDEAEES